jgi:hypothetical protein
MRKLYRRAREVIAWLGDDTNGITQELQGRSIPSPDCTTEQDDLKWCAAVSDLACRPYWERAWIVQEILLPRIVVLWFGTGTMKLQLFEDWYTAATTTSYYKGNLNLDLVLAHRSVHSRHRLWAGDDDLVRAFANTKCHDPRDKVYAFLGLLNPDLKGHIVQADYAKTSVDLYFDVMGILEMEDVAPGAQPFGQVLQISIGLAADELRNYPRYQTMSDKAELAFLLPSAAV